jgi:hypothetical protein
MKKCNFSFWSVPMTMIICLSFASTASALVRYSYTGNNYTVVDAPYTTSMSLSGWFEMDSPIPPNIAVPANLLASITNYSFSDGVNTLTNGNSGIFAAYFATDGLGNFTYWEINLSGPVPGAVNNPADIITTNSGVDRVDADANCVQLFNGICSGVSQLNGAESTVPGAWTRDILVPAMSGWGLIVLMMLIGAGSIYHLRRRSPPMA